MCTIQCPNCGSNQIKVLSESCRGQLTLGPEFEYQALIHECMECSEKGDFNGDGDTKYLESLKAAQKTLQKSLIEELGYLGFSMAYIERALELPQRTLARWKNGDVSAANLALLRIIKTIPWIVDVADHSFDQGYVTSRMLASLAEKLAEAANANGYKPSSRADLTDPNSISFEITMDKKPAIDTGDLISSGKNVSLAG